MGKTPKPLRILIDMSLASWPEWAALEAQGHTVKLADLEHDLYVGPRCWHMTEQHKPYFDLAIKAARKKRYGKGKGD